MKLTLISTFFIFQFSVTRIHAAETQDNMQKPSATKTEAKLKPIEAKITKPKTAQVKAQANKPQRELKENEYSLDQDNKIKIFKTKSYEGLLLSDDCFKNAVKKPNCIAYTKSLQQTPIKAEDAMESPYHNNLGSIHCKLLGGTGLIAKSFQGNESDFCQFKDGSLVSSWSAYYKTVQDQTQTTPQNQNQNKNKKPNE